MKVKNYSISNLFLIVMFVMLLVGCDFLYNPYLSKGSVAVESTTLPFDKYGLYKGKCCRFYCK